MDEGGDVRADAGGAGAGDDDCDFGGHFEGFVVFLVLIREMRVFFFYCFLVVLLFVSEGMGSCDIYMFEKGVVSYKTSRQNTFYMYLLSRFTMFFPWKTPFRGSCQFQIGIPNP